MHLRNSYKRFPSSKGVLIIQWNPAVPTPTIQWTVLFAPTKTSFLIGQFPIIYFLPMGKCWQKLGQAKRTTQQFLCGYYVLLWSNCQMLSIFAQLVITQSLNVTCWACPTYMYISQTHSYWGSHSVTTSHVSYCISPTLCQSDTQLLRQSVSQSVTTCKLLSQ